MESMRECIKYSSLCLIIILVVFNSCRSVRSYNSQPNGNSNKNDDQEVEIEVVAYHLNDTITRIYYSISNENLMFKKRDTSQFFYSSVFVACRLLPEINSRNIIDSATVFLSEKYTLDSKTTKSKGSFDLKLKATSFAYLDFWAIDKNRNIRYNHPISINKKNSSVAQNYLIKKDGNITFKNNFYFNDDVNIESQRNLNKNLIIECFAKTFGPALPPFSSAKPDDEKYKPDSVFSISNSGSIQIKVPKQGFYHIRNSETFHDGLSVYSFEKSYPGVNDIDEMINCTRYIMSKEEFETCKSAVDKKTAIDNFWVTIAGSNERAKELLKKYYGRVKEANKQFTSYTQGWKTDRGMLLVVFGNPINIYKSKNEEIWIYGQETDANALRFVFKKTENPYTDNDFILQRSAFFKEPWYTAVDYWRQGRIYLDYEK